MSAAGTPSSDPWVIPIRERIRYEEQFRQLKPINGVVTGDQAKGFLLQSQLPPMILGQIWGLADTDADGKMDIHEFLIACKLINLKLRGFEIPKVLPPTLLASVKQQAQTPPSIPPLPNPTLVGAPAPPRPEPPKPAVAPMPQMPGAPIMTQPVANNFIPTGIVPPMQSSMMGMQPVAPVQPLAPVSAGMSPLGAAPIGYIPPMQQPVMPPMGMQPMPSAVPMTTVPPMGAVPPMNTVPPVSAVPPMSAPMSAVPPVSAIPPLAPPASVIPAAVPPVAAVPGVSSTPRTSVSSLDKTMMESLQEWAVPHPTKLKYTQIFNTTDRTRSGFLTGAQARNVMMQTKLPQNTLAIIWALSDMDSDGRLGCEEFVLAMHLCEQAALGHPIPTTLPPELIPPTFKRPARTASRTASISSQGSGQPDVDLTLISQNSFEDKRKENFEKGQAELERRRKTLFDQQRKEAEERDRKEREEAEKREKARLEAERKRAEELEKQMRDQQERERMQEEERKRQADQRESARKEMERQRQLEWEKQRLQELQQQRQREQENVLKLKAKNQSLTIELSTLNDNVKELSQKICDTRVGVSNVKSTIDGMRSTRDTSMQEMSQLKSKLKEQNAKLLQLSQEKIRMEAKNKMNTAMNDKQAEQTKLAFENKEITIKNLKEKIEDMQGEIDTKMSDIENNNSQLTELKGELTKLVSECEDLYSVYEQKKTTVLGMKGSTKANDYSSAWGNDTSWGSTTTAPSAANEWPAQDSWATTATPVATAVATEAPAGSVRYRALYEFSARNNDEISFQPGDIINVPLEQTGEPGWLAGEIRGHTGWFPESYVELADSAVDSTTTSAFPIEESKPLEVVAEVPEISQEPEAAPALEATEEGEYYVASYPYQSAEAGDLTFSGGEYVLVIKKDGDWWTGKIDDRVGIFPSNYVQKADTIKAGKKPEIASVIAPYQASSNEQLSLERGQLIMIRKKTDSGWWEGELQAKGRKRQVGWFPATYVKVLNSSGRASGRTTPVSTTRMQQEVIIDKVIALYAYTAGNPDELSFLKDDIISVTAREEAAWWRGELNGVSGLFPSNYVQPLQQYHAHPNQFQFLQQSPAESPRNAFNKIHQELTRNLTQPVNNHTPVRNGYNKKRQDGIDELITTEMQYIEDLSVVKRVFEMPLKTSSILNQKELENIFVNLDDILHCNQIFLEDLLEKLEFDDDMIGDVILKNLPNMVPYVHFCKKQLDSASYLQKLYEDSTPFRDILRKCQADPALKGLPLSSFLLKPMQRITKYPLLIEKIIENTPDNHPDYQDLLEARSMADKFLKRINENMRQKEDYERLMWLQEHISQNEFSINFNGNTNKVGPRTLLHYGCLTKVKSGKELLGFLLSDFILLVQPSKSITQFTFQRNTNVTYKIYKQPLLIHEIQVSKTPIEAIDNLTNADRIISIQQDGKQPVSLLTTSANECNLWVKRIEIAQEMHEKAISLTRTRLRSTVNPNTWPNWLTVYVTSGHEIFPKSNCTNHAKRKTLKPGRSFVQNVYCKVALGECVQNTNVAMDERNGNILNGIPQPPALVWNDYMQFPIHEIAQDVVTLTVFEMCPFSPDEFLGRAEMKVMDLYQEWLVRRLKEPITKKLILHQVESGEVVIKYDLQLFDAF
ncbi:intersectin-1 isoform X4 [Atheta coriaria]|uniref:intersectin-1 isoform X4 n=1 Tax=Dalotia coriaria TaxID=877792 RepID=UPI0031F34026